MSHSLVTLITFPTRIEAEIAKSTLEAAGIKAMVSADDAGGMLPTPFAYTSGAELTIREQDREKAKAILGI